MRSVRGAVLLGFAALGLVALALSAWGWQLRLPGAVLAEGTIRPAERPFALSHPDGGVVAVVHVAPGDEVSQGEPLIVFRQDVILTELARIREQLAGLRLRRAALVAERDGTALAAHLPQGSPDHRRRAADEAALLAERRAAERSARARLEDAADAARRQLSGIAAENAALSTRRDLALSALADAEMLAAGGLLERHKLRELRDRVAALDADLARQAVREAQTRASRDALLMQKREITARRRVEILSELRDLDLAEVDLSARQSELRDARDRATLRAPVAGRVLDAVAVPGSYLRAGTDALTIVPDANGQEALLRVRPVDIAHVHAGQRLEILLPGNAPRHGATVVRIAADATLTHGSHEAGYDVIARLDPLKDGVLAPGQSIGALVLTTPRRALDYVIDPMRRIAARAMRTP